MTPSRAAALSAARCSIGSAMGFGPCIAASREVDALARRGPGFGSMSLVPVFAGRVDAPTFVALERAPLGWSVRAFPRPEC